MLRGGKRYWLLRTVSAGSLCLAVSSHAALAQPQAKTYSFDLPQQPLSISLKEYARVSGQQIIFTEDLVWGYVGKPLHGRMSAEDALKALLAGTDLIVDHTSAGAAMIRREPPPAPELAPPMPPAPRPTPIVPTTEHVVVTGLISSLQANLNFKRQAGGIVDVISSEDIGKFPDLDLAAAMQRIPGVTISRGVSSLGGVPTSIGTATQITVRGFGPSFNDTLFSSRQIASGLGRAFDFSAVGADFVSRVDVMKTPDATLSSGAIGATVNIRFPEPFDHPGFNLVTSASGSISPEQGNPTPSVKALVSDTFANNTFGILLDGGYSINRTRGNHVNIQGWEGTQVAPSQMAGAGPGASTTDSINAWFIQDYGVYRETTTDTRVNGRAVMQWKPREDLTVTLDENYSRDTLHAVQYGYSVWFNAGSLTNIAQNSNGTITSFIQPNSPTDFQSQVNGSVLQNADTGLNLKWTASSKLALTLDIDQSQAWLNPGGNLTSIDADVGYGPSTPGGTNGSNIGIMLPTGHNLPYPTGYGPGGNPSLFIDNGLIGSHVLPIVANQRLDRVQQLHADATWTPSDWLDVRAGYQYVGEHDDARARSDFPNNQWQAYAGYGPASNNYYAAGTPNCSASINGGNPCPAGAALPQSLFTTAIPTGNFIQGYGGSTNLPPQILAYSAYGVLNYLQSLGNPQTQYVAGATAPCCTPAFTGTYQLVNVVGSYSQVIENTHAVYVNGLARVTLAGLPLKINAGLRAIHTDATSIGLGQEPTALTVQPSDHTAFQVEYGPTSVIQGSKDYTYLLPNLDLTLEASDSLQLRFDASRTLTRPALDEITPVLNIGTAQRVGALVASGGNPGLSPYMSTNLDLSAAWYYQANSYVSVNAFNKNVTNFIVQGSTQQPINGVIDPTTGHPAIFTVSTNINGPAAEVYGVELAVQHVFGDSGFGFQANATLVGTNRPYNPYNLTVSGFAVTGLADSANLVGFYDRDGFQARAAVNWRDEYLDHFGQQQNVSRFGTEPTFVNANLQVDFSTSYDLTPNSDVYFSALNLNDSTFVTHGRYSEQLLDLVDYGRRFVLGFRIKI